MLRKHLKDWNEIEDKLKNLIITPPKILHVEDFYSKELGYFIETSLVFKKFGVPKTILGVADCFISNMQDLFNYALEEDRFETLSILNKAIDSQFLIFRCYIKIYYEDVKTVKEMERILERILYRFNEHKRKKLNNYHNG